MEVVIIAGKYVLFQKIDLMCDIILELKWIFVIWTEYVHQMVCLYSLYWSFIEKQVGHSAVSFIPDQRGKYPQYSLFSKLTKKKKKKKKSYHEFNFK